MKKELYTMALSSFAVHGTASLKIFTKVLGNRILPVPTMLLSGLTNMGTIKTFEPPFEELLESSLQMALLRDIELILYVGYLGYENQAYIILQKINKYQEIIKTIIVDPVSGDNGKLYISEQVLKKWPDLLGKANFVFPNITELKIFTGRPLNESVNQEILLDEFKSKFPKAVLVAKSIDVENGRIGVRLVDGAEVFSYGLPVIPKTFGGTGDLFLAFFILIHFHRKENLITSIKLAVNKTHEIIEHSYLQKSEELVLNI